MVIYEVKSVKFLSWNSNYHCLMIKINGEKETKLRAHPNVLGMEAANGQGGGRPTGSTPSAPSLNSANLPL
jgi:hypothetical protein